MDIQAESGAEIYRGALAHADLAVSNPATSSYISFRNISSTTVRLTVTMVEGMPRGPSGSSAIGVHDIPPGEHYTSEFHVSYGGGPGANVWRTHFTLSPVDGSSPPRTLRIMLVNAPGRLPQLAAGDNMATVQVT